MCEALGVSRSGWYASCSRQRPTAREAEDADLLDKIRAIHEASRRTYGSLRVHAQLARDGVHVNRDRVVRLMKAAGPHPRAIVTGHHPHDTPHDPTAGDPPGHGPHNQIGHSVPIEVPDLIHRP